MTVSKVLGFNKRKKNKRSTNEVGTRKSMQRNKTRVVTPYRQGRTGRVLKWKYDMLPRVLAPQAPWYPAPAWADAAVATTPRPQMLMLVLSLLLCYWVSVMLYCWVFLLLLFVEVAGKLLLISQSRAMLALEHVDDIEFDNKFFGCWSPKLRKPQWLGRC